MHRLPENGLPGWLTVVTLKKPLRPIRKRRLQSGYASRHGRVARRRGRKATHHSRSIARRLPGDNLVRREVDYIQGQALGAGGRLLSGQIDGKVSAVTSGKGNTPITAATTRAR